jgi:sodium transport system permease protein
MGKAGSAPSPALPLAVSLAAVALGWAAMQATMAATVRWGLKPMLVASELALLAPALLGAALLRQPLAATLGLRRPDGRTAVLALAIGAAFWAASLGVFSLQSLAWPLPPAYLEGFRRIHAALRPAGPLDAVVSVLAIAVAPAACEEILFRGAVQPSLQRRLPAWAAVGVTAILFAAVHWDPYRTLFAVAAGVGLGLVRLRSGSVVPPLLAHAALNTATFVVVQLLDESQAAADPPAWLGALLLAGGAAAAALILRALPARGGSG